MTTLKIRGKKVGSTAVTRVKRIVFLHWTAKQANADVDICSKVDDLSQSWGHQIALIKLCTDHEESFLIRSDLQQHLPQPLMGISV